jgi:hypothetical protein
MLMILGDCAAVAGHNIDCKPRLAGVVADPADIAPAMAIRSISPRMLSLSPQGNPLLLNRPAADLVMLRP